MEIQTDDYDTLQHEQANRQNEPYQALDFDQPKKEVANTPRSFISRNKAIWVFLIILTTVVIAILIAVVIIFTTTVKHDACQSHPCHYGNCRSNGDGFECLCFLGYTGLYCENDTDECSSNPCVYGTCIDGISNYRCACDNGYGGTNCEYLKRTDCVDILSYTGSRMDGIYFVRTWKSHQVMKVYCDMATDGGGWTVFQYRFDGLIDFYRSFSEYDAGFGNLTTEFWLGLSNIQEIASQGQTDLRIDLEAANGTKAYETFDNFYLSPGPAYTLHLGRTIASLRISSTNRFGEHHNGSDFSTYDHDVDSSSYSWAVDRHGAWWYNYCATANLNGQYLTPGTNNSNSMNYYSFKDTVSLKTSKMMIRRK